MQHKHNKSPTFVLCLSLHLTSFIYSSNIEIVLLQPNYNYSQKRCR